MMTIKRTSEVYGFHNSKLSKISQNHVLNSEGLLLKMGRTQSLGNAISNITWSFMEPHEVKELWKYLETAPMIVS